MTTGSDLPRILAFRHHDPFSVMGLHLLETGRHVARALIPGAQKVWWQDTTRPMQRLPGTDLFQIEMTAESCCDIRHPWIIWQDDDGLHQMIDPYTFDPQIPDFDLHLFAEGRHHHLYRVLGAHQHEVDGIRGTRFATWAPNAERVSVVGHFNRWDGRCFPMRSRGGSGVWELFIPGIEPGELYRFEIRSSADGGIHLKTDPYGQHFELRPDTASIVTGSSVHHWQDEGWMQQRQGWDWQHAPVSVYEVHAGSWRLHEDGSYYNYRHMAHELVEYVSSMGYTHIELLPVAEHPLDASWGYQTTGYFAPTSRFGTPDDFRYFVDYCHQHGIGVILDWVPAHFPKDAHGLARFDGTPLYEHEDPRLGEHRDWGTLIYNYGRNEVRNFLMASAVFWLEEFHIDGLRVDAVASMLYLDYSREAGEWLPNRYGGNENLEAIDFLRELNAVVHQRFPGAVVMAEESTAWPQVTRPGWSGGLGFSIKWNMGWMHDILLYFSRDPVHRPFHHNQLTFSMLYAFTENFILPFSHDEVVHGKGHMLQKMPGDEWQRFANLRALYTFMFTHPGKKLLFMGSDMAQGTEWNHAGTLPWYLLDYPHHQGIQKLVADLNRIYRDVPALHALDFDQAGFAWVDCQDAGQSVVSFLRKADNGDCLLVIMNLTPVPRHRYRIGLPLSGPWKEIFNSDATCYGGSNLGNAMLLAEDIPYMGQVCSAEFLLPPLAGIVLQPCGDDA